MLDLKNLNPNQLKAVTSPDGPVVVIAGAGTGKTKVLTTRIAYLIEHHIYDPSRILAITFTNKAANEMKYRISKLVSNYYLPWVGTYHSICLKILKQDIGNLNKSTNFGVIDDEDQMSVIKEIYRIANITNSVCSSVKPKKALEVISLIKTNGININSYEEGTNFLSNLGMFTLDAYKCIKLVFNEYQRKLELNNLLDFDDLLIYTEILLTKFGIIREKWQNYFQYILVDEFQDTNTIQFNILKKLINPKTQNIFIVGDPDQSIYQWRGAYEHVFRDFRNAYPNAQLIILDTNYRSTKSILSGSNALIANNLDRIKKDLQTENPSGEKIYVYEGDSKAQEGLFIAKKILALTKNNKYSFSDIAILYRANYLSRFIEEQLINNNIPYVIFGGIKFYQRKEIKDLLAYLKLMVNDDEVSIKRIINIPRRNIGGMTVDKIEKYCQTNNINFYDALKLTDTDWNWKSVNEFYKLIEQLRSQCKGLSVSQSLQLIIKTINYEEYLKSLDLEDKQENVNELINTISKYEEEHEKASISSYLQEISLYTDTSEQKVDIGNFVTLMTVHVAKGSEYKIVFLAAFNQDVFPSPKAENISEERRIAYVAMTRAKEQLYITYAHSGGGFAVTNIAHPESIFLHEIGKNNYEKIQEEFVSISKADLNWYNSKEAINYDNQYETKPINFNIGDVLTHTTFGSGVVIGIDGDILTIAFKAPWGVKSIIKSHKALKRMKN